MRRQRESNHKILKSVERICLFLFLILGIVVICGIYYLKREDASTKRGMEETRRENTRQEDTELLDILDLYPNNLTLMEELPDITFTKEDGSPVKMKEYLGKTVILTYWNSWCPDCHKEFEHLEEYRQLINSYESVEFVLVNRLDGEKESKESALYYLTDNQITIDNLFDEDAKVYKELGLTMVPTTLIIDPEGILRVIRPNTISNVSEMQALLEYALYGGSYATETFITESLSGEDGGVHINYLDITGTSPVGHDVLSESQGLMLEHAALTNNKQLFDSAHSFLHQHMSENPLAAWMKSKDKKQADTNALLDDLRIYKSLQKAQNLWGGYEAYLTELSESIYKYNTDKNKLIDFYDFKLKKKASRFTLCYADFEALQYLTNDNPNFISVYENILILVREGFISNDFPLYYSWYDYKIDEYVKDELNMAEAMVTLYHLAQIGELKEETVEWIRTKIEMDGIKARYTVGGEVVEGYNYESTAVNALVALIANEIGDTKLRSDAVKRMERLRINNTENILNGSFGYKDGSNISSFDQCMPLLAYDKMETDLYKMKSNK